jgi:ribose 5-phosphate isomerase RpiB
MENFPAISGHPEGGSMKIAVINEISAADKNADILKALDGRGHEILNLGNTSSSDSPGLLYIHTGLMSALLLNLKVVDFVVGGCGTGLGYLNAVMQYPGVVCGHLLTPLDAFLFARINAGNCVSLALNQGYGWAGDVNLRLMFDALFTPEAGCGYPANRSEPQKQGRILLAQISQVTHRPMTEILLSLPNEVIRPVLNFPAFRPVLEQAAVVNTGFHSALEKLS